MFLDKLTCGELAVTRCGRRVVDGEIRSSSLEVEVLDGEGEDDGEEDAEAGDHGCDDAQELVAEPKVVLQEGRHGGGGDAVREQQGLVQVAELRGQEAVERPRHRVGPVVPTPPHGDALRAFSGRDKNWSVLPLP